MPLLTEETVKVIEFLTEGVPADLDEPIEGDVVLDHQPHTGATLMLPAENPHDRA